MAVLRCCETHAPATIYRAYLQSFRRLPCDVAGCPHAAVVWLDPEELHDYALGARVFWERATLTRLRVDARALTDLDALPRQRSAFLLGHWHERRA